MVKFIRHGKSTWIVFKCKECGCVFEADRESYHITEDSDLVQQLKNLADQHQYLEEVEHCDRMAITACPSCGAACFVADPDVPLKPKLYHCHLHEELKRARRNTIPSSTVSTRG